MNAKKTKAFWEALDDLRASSKLVIDRPKGSHHPRYSDLIYPVDYGYLESTTSMDGHGIDVWKGSELTEKLNAVIITVDLKKKDSEIKLLLGCTADEKRMVIEFHNSSELMKGLLIQR
jgi:inorganic pyrophosphatase